MVSFEIFSGDTLLQKYEQKIGNATPKVVAVMNFGFMKSMALFHNLPLLEPLCKRSSVIDFSGLRLTSLGSMFFTDRISLFDKKTISCIVFQPLQLILLSVVPHN